MDGMNMLLLLLDDEDDSDDDFNLSISSRRPRMMRPRIDWFQLLDEVAFQERFRLSKSMFQEVLDLIEPDITPDTPLNAAIPATIQLQVAIRFMATGSFYITMGDFTGISKTSVWRILLKVAEAIAELRNRYINMPTPQQIRMVQCRNFNQAGFIRTIGAVDCVHVRIRSYGGRNAELFRNRKSFFSINTQVIVNSRLEMMDIVARWPGSSHDATISDNSRIKERFESGEFGNSLLLADSAYSDLPFIMKPLPNPTTPAEVLYNESQIRSRTMVERCFGVWGRMFAVLTMGSRFWTSDRTMAIIIASAVLYNITRRAIPPPVVNLAIYNYIPQTYDAINMNDERRHIIDSYFRRLV